MSVREDNGGRPAFGGALAPERAREVSDRLLGDYAPLYRKLAE